MRFLRADQTSRGTERRLADDRGAALIEASLVAPVLLIIVLAIMEYGLVFRDYLTVSDTVADAARTGAVQGRDKTISGQTADFSIVSSIRQNTAGLRYTDVERIVVFRGGPPQAGSAIDQVPASCKTGTASSPSDNCNVYPVEAALLAIQYGNNDFFECNAAGQPACGWSPGGTFVSDERLDGTINVGGQFPIDYLGVYLEVRHRYVTGLFGDEFVIKDASIARLEAGRREDT
jgi:hypothetical protein